MELFKDLVAARPDVQQWTSGLWGYDLICDCGCSSSCSSHWLVEHANKLQQQEIHRRKEEKMVDEDIDEDPDDLIDVADEIAFAASEPPLLPANGVPWPQEWHDIVTAARSLRRKAFWEMFAGCAILTMIFSELGWAVLPPLDAAKHACHNLLNPVFLTIILATFSEGRIAILHLGTLPLNTGPRLSQHLH